MHPYEESLRLLLNEVRLGYNPDDEMTVRDIRRRRSILGRIAWDVYRLRPDCCYLTAMAAQQITTGAGVRMLKKALVAINRRSGAMTFKKIPWDTSRPGCTIVCYADSGYAKQREGRSLMGYLVSVAPSGGAAHIGRMVKAMLIGFKSHVQRRVSASTTIAELQAAVDGLSAAEFAEGILNEMGVMTTIILLTDCKNLWDNVHSAPPSLAQPRFMPHLSRLREKFNPRTGSSGRDTFAFVPHWSYARRLLDQGDEWRSSSRLYARRDHGSDDGGDVLSEDVERNSAETARTQRKRSVKAAQKNNGAPRIFVANYFVIA